MGAICITCHSLQPHEQLKLQGCTNVSVKNGPGWVVSGFGKSATRTNAQALGPDDYIVVRDDISGALRLEKGPGLFFCGAYETIVEARKMLSLANNEFVKIEDSITGKIRVVTGEASVFLEPLEKLLKPQFAAQKYTHKGVQVACEVDQENALLVRNKETGEQSLVTKPQLFFPGPYEEVEEVRPLIRLLEYETMVIRNPEGRFNFMEGCAINDHHSVASTAIPAAHAGAGAGAGAGVGGGVGKGADSTPPTTIAKGQQRASAATSSSSIVTATSTGAFFLPPYCAIEELQWSTGLRKTGKKARVQRIDKRPQFMNYEFLCRTKDNVELVIAVTFFWQIVNVPLMLKYTSDPPGDVCAHARSAVTNEITKCSLEEFMADVNSVVEKAIFQEKEGGEDFYGDRGVKIHTVEVLHYQCKDANVEKVLQQIIQESTNRMNAMQVQQSRNEVNVFALTGQIDEEKLRGGLLDVRHKHHRAEALMEGEAEADRVKSFITGLSGVVDTETAVDLFKTMRKVDVMARLSEGPAHMYFTPNDVDLRIETNVTEAPNLPNVPERSNKSASRRHQQAKTRHGADSGSGSADFSAPLGGAGAGAGAARGEARHAPKRSA